MKSVYTKAKRFLVDRIPAKDANQILNSYLETPSKNDIPVEMSELFRRLLQSAQNSNMKAGVIGKSIDGFPNLGKALFNFNPKRIENKFNDAPDLLLTHIVEELHPRGKVRTGSASIWPKYCRTILSAARFFNGFSNADEFYEWANGLYADKRSMPALPLILAEEIEGIGYPLACDFLKDLGFIEYGKPDVHVIQIFVGIGLCQPKPSPYQVQKVITKIAESVGVSSFNVDKLFWLIGSGKFYNHEEFGINGKIGRMKVEFISHFNN